MNLKDVRGKLAAKRAELNELYAKHKTEDGINYEASVADAEKFRELHAEINDLGTREMFLRGHEDNERELKNLQEIDSSVPFGGYTSVASTEVKTLGDYFVESVCKHIQNGNPALGQVYTAAELDMKHFALPMESKTNFTTSAGYPPQSLRTGRLIYSAQQTPKVIDLIPQEVSPYAVAKWVKESTFTNSAAETAEQSGTIPESTLAYSEVTASHAKIATTIPMSREVLADEAKSRELVNSRLVAMIMQRLDNQLLNGSGTAPAMFGFLATSGIQTTARLSGATPPEYQGDALYRAIQKVNYTGFANASGFILSPTDYQTVRLGKTTGSGEYLVAPVTVAGAEMLWGLPVVQTTFMAAGTSLCGDFAGYSRLYTRQGIEFDFTNAHGAEFLSDMYRVKTTLRGVLAVERPAAFCTVTSM